MSTAYRIQDKSNAHINGRPVTSYHVFTLDAHLRAYVHAGNGFAPGHDRTDAQCWADWKRRETTEEVEFI